MQTTIGGYCVKVEHNGIPYTIHTKEGVRGFNIPCLAWYDGTQWRVSVRGKEYEVKHVICDLKGVTAHEFSKQ